MEKRGKPTYVARERRGELLELFQVASNIHLAILVEQHAQQRLRPARILDGLRGEEDVVVGAIVEAAVLRRRRRLLARWVPEEEDDAVDRPIRARASDFVLGVPVVLMQRCAVGKWWAS